MNKESNSHHSSKKLIREYARITINFPETQDTLDNITVSTATYEWLLKLNRKWRPGCRPLALETAGSFSLKSYVGFLQSPTGESIEILPKTCASLPDANKIREDRYLLQRMFQTALGIKPREAGPAHLKRMDTPLHEWVIGQFLSELQNIVRRGLCGDYKRIEEEARFIRGQLDIVKQSVQRPGKAGWFNIRHDIFDLDRIENRIIKKALEVAYAFTKNSSNWRLANTLRHQLITLPTSSDPIRDFSNWGHSKLLQHYSAIKPWCELLIKQLNPNFQAGDFQGISLLFPMEKLFEKYVENELRNKLSAKNSLKSQPSRFSMVTHTPRGRSEEEWFKLKPDLLLESEHSVSILDAKWKLLNESKNSSEDKYGLSQSDFYQMFAYGHTYLKGKGCIMLIYPKYASFNSVLPKFEFDKKLRVWVVPFDLEKGELVSGDWCNDFEIHP